MNKNNETWDAFQKVKNHLLTQNKKSMDESGSLCRYRGVNGLKCAIGCLIPDEVYYSNLEGCSFLNIIKQKEIKPFLNHLNIELMHNGKFFTLGRKLQYIHDRIDVEFWEWELNALEEILKEIM